ncbi:MAG: hypothetical protein K6E63_07615 [Lachnospiraceae bacterium]|nr:hypothetical protein [Lachnospiraceae bacterium]
MTINHVLASGSKWPTGSSKPPAKTTETVAENQDYYVRPLSVPGMTATPAFHSGNIGTSDKSVTFTYSNSSVTEEKDLDNAKIVGLNEDKDHEYTEEEVKRIGLEDGNGKPLVKGKEFTEVISEKTDDDGKLKWVIEYEPIEGKSKGHKGVEVKKPDPNKPKHNVTVHYTLPSPGNGVAGQSVAPTVVKSYYEGETYSIAAPRVAVPGKKGKYYRQSNYYVTGLMGTTDQEHTVIYEYSESVAEVPFQVEVFYKVEAKEGETPPTLPKDVKIRPLQNGDPYSITSPPVNGYQPDIKVVEGKIEGKNVVATVTYKPQYKVTINYRSPGSDSSYILVEDLYPDGAKYHYDTKQIIKENNNIHTEEMIEKQLAAWTITPADVSGTIQSADVTVEVTASCPHPGANRMYMNTSDESHTPFCSLCSHIGSPEAHTFADSVFLAPEELVKIKEYDTLEDAKKHYPAGAMAKICTKCGEPKLTDPNEEICPASSKDDPQPHLWGSWNKVSDTQCSRTCARCKLTTTTSHAWGNWEYCTSKNHVRRCSLCKCTETGDHGAWSNVSVHKQATCIADAEVGATCGICNKQINNVYYGLVGSINPNYVRTGHDFTGGGYARIQGGHVQKCKVCGAFDMEHHESHAWSDWYVTEGGDSCTGTRTMKRDCICGASETKTEENSHNYVRDPSRETAATCESAGTECYTCSKCGDHNDKNVEALGHAWVEDEGNYPAKCGQEGRMWWHCANPGCSATKKDDCPAPSDHEWVPNWISKASCTREGVKDGEICSHCGERRNEGNMEYVDRLNHDLETTKTLKRSGTYVSKTGNAAIDEEVWVVTNRCKTCGYNFPEAVYTVAKSGNISRYKIEPGDVRVNEIGDGIHVSGQFGKANAVYFNNTVNGAFKEVVDNLLNIYRQKEGSVITEFTPEFMNSLKDGEYEMIHVNGDELSAATLTVRDHKFVTPEGAQDGKLPGIKSLDESGVITDEPDPDHSEKIEVGGQEVDYYPWMADGEMLFYLGQIGDNAAAVNAPDMGEGYTPQTVRADPSVTPATADFDRREGSKENADIVVIKCDKGHAFDSAHPISLFGQYLPATEEVEPDEEGAEKITRTNYVIEGDKVTFKKEYLETLGEGRHEIGLNYTDGCQAYFTLTVKGNAGDDPGLLEAEEWNLFEDADDHVYTVSGITSAEEVANSNAGSAKFFDAVLSKDKMTVKLKEGVDRKKAAAADTFDFDLGAQGSVSYILPFTYSKPELKLSSTRGTVKKGKETVLKTRVLLRTENGNLTPYDLSGAAVKYGSSTVTIGENGLVSITASGKSADSIVIKKDGWNDKDPVALKYTITEGKADQDILDVDLGGLKLVTLSTKAPDQSFTFPLALNGEPVAAEAVTVLEGKKGEQNLVSVGDGTLTFSIGRSGIGKGSYTVNLKAGNAKRAVKVKVTDKAYGATGKIKQKYDVVTKKPMVIEPKLKELGGTITNVTVSKIELKKGTPLPATSFNAVMNNGNIEVTYKGAEELKAANLAIGNMTLTLTVIDSSAGGNPVSVDMLLKNVSAKKTTPKVKAAKVIVPKDAAESGDGTYVIGTANIISTYRDSAKHTKMIAPVEVTLVNKNVEAETDPSNKSRILIKKLTGKSGNVKATLTYPGGVTKTITIKVSKGKK